ncbi:MAG: C4-type zinc ribbon domain-containing protein [Terriglobia bacterium]
MPESSIIGQRADIPDVRGHPGGKHGSGEAVHPDLKTVIELQQLDARIAELNAQIDALPSQIQTLETQLHEFIHAHEERQARLAKNQKERRDLENEIKTIQVRITKHKDQLYEVKTNEQYKAMLKEIGGEEGKIRAFEDQILEKMIEAEQLEKLIREAASRLDAEKARVAGEVRQLQALRQADVEERDGLQAQRKRDEASVGPQVLEHYERVRRARRGIAVAAVRDGFCTGCNVLLRPQFYNEARSNLSVLACENCSRILYYVEPPVAPEESGDQTAQAPA